jgi:hypothetical protein
MKSKRYTQFGTFTVIIMSALLIVFATLLLVRGFSPGAETHMFATLVLIFTVCLLTFYKLTIIVDDTTISFKLGIGVFSKSYKISEIKSCKPVKNLWIYGVGIRKLPNGWLYNVSGLKAIELRFKDSTKVIRIGTDKPYEIAGVIKDLIGTELESEDDKPEYKIQSKTRNTIILLAIVGAIVGGDIYYSSLPTKIDMKETQLEISGGYGFSINYNDISTIDTICQMPNIEMRTNGFASGKVCKGYFRLTNIGSASLFIDFGVSPFVQLVLKNGRVIFFNLKDRRSTIETFKKIKSKAELK